MKTLYLAATASALLAIGISPTAKAAPGGTRSFMAAECTVASGTATYSSIGQIANTSGTTLKLWCPIISDPQVGLPTVTSFESLEIDAFSNGCIGGIPGTAAALYDVPKLGGVATTSGASIPGSCLPGVYPLTPAFTLIHPGDYTYILVTLGPPISGSFSTFWGYSLTNN